MRKRLFKEDFATNFKNFFCGFGRASIYTGFGIYAIPTLVRKVKEEFELIKKQPFEYLFGSMLGVGLGALILEDQISSYMFYEYYPNYSFFIPIGTNLLSICYELSRLRKNVIKRNNKIEKEEKKIKHLSKFDEDIILRT